MFPDPVRGSEDRTVQILKPFDRTGVPLLTLQQLMRVCLDPQRDRFCPSLVSGSGFVAFLLLQLEPSTTQPGSPVAAGVVQVAVVMVEFLEEENPGVCLRGCITSASHMFFKELFTADVHHVCCLLRLPSCPPPLSSTLVLTLKHRSCVLSSHPHPTPARIPFTLLTMLDVRFRQPSIPQSLHSSSSCFLLPVGGSVTHIGPHCQTQIHSIDQKPSAALRVYAS